MKVQTTGSISSLLLGQLFPRVRVRTARRCTVIRCRDPHTAHLPPILLKTDGYRCVQLEARTEPTPNVEDIIHSYCSGLAVQADRYSKTRLWALTGTQRTADDSTPARDESESAMRCSGLNGGMKRTGVERENSPC
ncbi:hypothetical protein DPEC_G00064420 [Dallia pectoralis]|uniref:Uncharacterized protein n=1 Tax=Dallia pectoralis TaxID=75939 RepID=A0ACC2H8C4_DALPE|nr:hypothetical protein DPEC_G00064420 [Dallia pectoralis]